MTRLTRPCENTENGKYIPYTTGTYTGIFPDCTLGEVVKRLAEYEDLGFTPKEIAYLAKFFKDKTSTEEIEANIKTAAKLMEWAKWKELEEQGRLIVLSVEDIHPCKGCDTGWGSVSSEGCTSCHDSCERLMQYNERYRT